MQITSSFNRSSLVNSIDESELQHGRTYNKLLLRHKRIKCTHDLKRVGCGGSERGRVRVWGVGGVRGGG